MSDLDAIQELYREMPKLCHASNIIRKYGDRKTTSKQKAALDAIVVEYKKYITHVLNITTYDEQSIREKVDCLNTYYNFIHNVLLIISFLYELYVFYMLDNIF